MTIKTIEQAGAAPDGGNGSHRLPEGASHSTRITTDAGAFETPSRMASHVEQMAR